VITPVDAFYATDANYILESAEKGSVVGRYSFLGLEPVVWIEIRGKTCTLTEEDGQEKTFTLRHPLKMIGEVLKDRPFIGRGDLSPFPGGAVGYIGYESVGRWEKIPFDPEKPGLNLPDSVFFITRYNLVFDNLMHNLKIVCNVRVGKNPETDYNNAVAGLEEIQKKLEKPAQPPPAVSQLPRVGRLKSNFTKEEYKKTIEQIKELITQGEAIQVVLSRRIEADYHDDPFLIFRALRRINPSPYMFYLDFDTFSILGASPEVMVRVDSGKAMLRPIAGTRPRGKDQEEDGKLRAELLRDEKELAEHLMLVDLGRNDLGRIAKPGTVKVDRMMEVEMYSHVMHIVSEVSAQLADKMDVFDVIRAVFPAGTVSGAPKVRAMEIIEDFETVTRGPYAGLVGYLSYTGTFDSCITIRSLVCKDGKIYLQTGGGVVYDSVPELEHEETANKARALLSALSIGGQEQ